MSPTKVAIRMMMAQVRTHPSGRYNAPIKLALALHSTQVNSGKPQSAIGDILRLFVHASVRCMVPCDGVCAMQV
jgi:hypothetical protein